jgi:hypothetical protein
MQLTTLAGLSQWRSPSIPRHPALLIKRARNNTIETRTAPARQGPGLSQKVLFILNVFVYHWCMIRPSPATDRHTEPHERPNGLQQDPADREAAFVRAAFPFSQGRMLSGRQHTAPFLKHRPSNEKPNI